MESTVSCRICGHTAVTLARHLKASHEITADLYRAQYPGARIRSEACEANRSAATSKAHAEHSRTGRKKVVTCPCGLAHEVGLTFASKDLRCPSCKERDLAAQPPKVRGPSPLKGRTPSPETRAKMSASAGWNRGLTKETDPRVANAAEAMKGRTSWSKGLTKGTHPSLQSTSDKLRTWAGPQRYWSNGLKVDLSDVDFTPFLDETGAVDRKIMAEELGLSEVTVTKYMESLGLRLSTKYVDARVAQDVKDGRFHEMSRQSAEISTIRLTPEQLEPYKLGNGKVVLARAMAGLGHVYAIIKRECDRLKIPTHTHLVKQTLCLDAVSKVLGEPYMQEWKSTAFRNPKTGHRFKFDGYFPRHHLIVEFHGYQHSTFPNVFHKTLADFQASLDRDAEKEAQARAARVAYLVLHEKEPFTDPEFIREAWLDAVGRA